MLLVALLGIVLLLNLGHDERKPEEELPLAEVAKITGTANLSNGWLFGTPYNGSDWVVTRVIVNVAVFEKDSVVWTPQTGIPPPPDYKASDDAGRSARDSSKGTTTKLSWQDMPEVTLRWSRDFSDNVTIRPLATGSFQIKVAGDNEVANAPWTWILKKAFGHKETPNK